MKAKCYSWAKFQDGLVEISVDEEMLQHIMKKYKDEIRNLAEQEKYSEVYEATDDLLRLEGLLNETED